MGQKSTTPARPIYTHPNSYSGSQVPTSSTPVPAYQYGYGNVHNIPTFSAKKEISIGNSNSTSSSTIRPSSTLYSAPVGKTTGSSQYEVSHYRTTSMYTTSGVPNQRPSAPPYEHVCATGTPTVRSSSTLYSSPVGNSGSSQSEVSHITTSTYTTSGVPNQRPSTPAYEHARAAGIPTVLRSSSTLYSSPVGNSTGSSQSEASLRTTSTYTTSGVLNQKPATPAYEHVRATLTQEQKPESSILGGTPVTVKPAIQIQKLTVAQTSDVESHDLFTNTSKSLVKEDNCTHTTEGQANRNVVIPHEAKNSVIRAKYSKETNVVEHQKQRTRRPRKQRTIKNQNLRPKIFNDSSFPTTASECRIGGKKNSFLNAKKIQSSNKTLSNEFNEKIFIENAIVVARMLDCVNLETLSDASKIMLKELHDKLNCLDDETNCDRQDQTFCLNNRNENEVEISQQKLKPGDIFKSACSISTEEEEEEDDDDNDVVLEDSRNNTNNNVQHVFGTIYYCTACEQDLHGESAAASHVCRGDCNFVTSDVKSESKNVPLDIVRAEIRSDVQQMWREVNRAQKGRWYNISHVKDGVFQCTTCDVNLESTDHVIEHVKQRDHQQLLAQIRADETEEDGVWRQVPRALKFNRKHFVLLNTDGNEGFVCKACMSEVPFTLGKLISHLTTDSHVQEVRRKK